MYVGRDPLLFDNEGRTGTLTVDSGASVTYGGSHDGTIGSLSVGQSATITGPVWVTSTADSGSDVHIALDPVDASTIAIRNNTQTTQSIKSSLTVATNKRLTLTADSGGAGGISRLIELHMTGTYDRPWISWFDENNLHRAAFGYHTNDLTEGLHQALEVKTIADQAGSNPTDMRTRFSIGTNADRVLTGFNYSTGIEINQGEVPGGNGSGVVEQFGITLRGYKRDGSASQIVGQFVVETETTDAVTGFIDVINISSTQPHQLVLLKSGNSSSGSCGVFVKRGNGTNTDAFVFKNRTGVFEIGPVATVPSGAATNGRLYVAASGALTYVSPAGTATAIGPA